MALHQSHRSETSMEQTYEPQTPSGLTDADHDYWDDLMPDQWDDRSHYGLDSGMNTPTIPQIQLPKPELEILEKSLYLTLEEIYFGTTKTVKLRKKNAEDANKSKRSKEMVLNVPVYPGIATGARIRFVDASASEDGPRHELHFVVCEKKHALYERELCDIRHTIDITAQEAVTGWTRSVQAIEGEKIHITHAGPSRVGLEKNFPGRGMPDFKNPNERGSFVVAVNIQPEGVSNPVS